MSRTIFVRSNGFAVDVDSDGVAHLILGRADSMPVTAAAGHTELGRVWRVLNDTTDVRCLLIRCVCEGFGASGTLEVVSELVGDASS